MTIGASISDFDLSRSMRSLIRLAPGRWLPAALVIPTCILGFVAFSVASRSLQLWFLLFVACVPVALSYWAGARDLFAPLPVLTAAFFVYFVLPGLYFLWQPATFLTEPDHVLNTSLGLALLGLLAFYAGYLIPLERSPALPPRLPPLARWRPGDVRLVGLVSAVLAAGAFLLFGQLVGGVVSYIQNLGRASALNQGLIYLVWGILLMKLGALTVTADWLSRPRLSRRQMAFLGAYVLASLLLLGMGGSRLLFIIGVLQALILVHYLRRRLTLPLVGGVGLLLLVGVVIILGEYRNYTSPQLDVGAERISLQEYINTIASDPTYIERRFIHNYFDSLEVLMLTVDAVPESFDHTNGSTFAALALQPLPRAIRPDWTLYPDDLRRVYSDQPAFGRVLALVTELYLNFSWLGVAAGMMIFGMVARAAYHYLQHQPSNPGRVLIYALTITGLIVVFRGSFVGSMSFLLMDLLPVIAAVWWLDRRAVPAVSS